ncbi:hypothetical protein ACFE04_025430 [Oxalis oulophora]
MDRNDAVISPELELPECPVCLQMYDSEYTIPRVLACGHTTCQDCLTHLPTKFPNTIRCPACTQLVKFPNGGGPTSLPKNIDLLRLSNPPPPQKPHKTLTHQNQNDSFLFTNCSSYQLYSTWKKWVLPSVDRSKVSLLEVGFLIKDNHVLKFGYLAKVMKCLADMTEDERQELLLVFEACSNARRSVCRVLGLWGDLESGSLCIVFEKFYDMVIVDYYGVVKNGLFSFALMGMEMCEAVISLHKEGLVAGCLGVSCFKSDEFGHVYVDVSEILMMGREIRKLVAEAGFGGRKVEDEEVRVLASKLSKVGVFVSPEALFEILKKKGVEVEFGGCSKYLVGNGSDVWLLACVLLSFLYRKQFNEEILCSVITITDEISFEKVTSLFRESLGEEFIPLQQIICQCLNFDPESRPLVTDVWKCIREMVILPQSDNAVKADDLAIGEKCKGRCLILLELCQLRKEIVETKVIDEVHEEEECPVVGETSSEKQLVDGLSEGNVKWKDLKGQLDCITGLAVGGGFLFGSSYDKSIHVWSLVDFVHVHTFLGHEHKVMALIYVDEEEPFCVSADGGGCIYVWSTCSPHSQEPLKKWYEEKDWRFSGIHTLTAAGNGYIYTGSGDKTIKAWSLKDGTLFCTMKGHRSTVSSLAVCNGVLYSGSWDGTIRLWSLSDHSLLTVLGEDTPVNLGAVLSIAADEQILVASHENGFVKIWRDDLLVKATKNHVGAVFAVSMEGKWLFTGGRDKTINVQELFTGDDLDVDPLLVGSITCILSRKMIKASGGYRAAGGYSGFYCL